MSRVDDSNAERRVEEARLADIRNKEKQQKERTAESTAFDRALAEKAQVATKASKGFADKLGDARQPAAEARAEKGGEAKTSADRAEKEGKQAAAQQRPAAQGPLKKDNKPLPQQPAPNPRAQQQAQAKAGQPQVAQPRPEPAQPRAGEKDHKAGDLSSERAQNARSEDMQGAAGTAKGGKKPGAPVDAASDDGGSGQKGQQDGGKDSKGTSFRLPPAALMAPPPLARPKEAGGSRLRGLAQEVVDKIVSRVLVGTNRQGMAEFRIDLKSSALKGLSIKVSGGRGGKIRAVFSGSDREVLAALKDSSQDLVDALAAKGLTLEDLSFEEAPPR
jgi:hypothetical protein